MLGQLYLWHLEQGTMAATEGERAEARGAAKLLRYLFGGQVEQSVKARFQPPAPPVAYDYMRSDGSDEEPNAEESLQ